VRWLEWSVTVERLNIGGIDPVHDWLTVQRSKGLKLRTEDHRLVRAT
jgi:hypothetical protein